MLKQIFIRFLALVSVTILLVKFTVIDKLKVEHSISVRATNTTQSESTLTIWEELLKCQQIRLTRLHSKCKMLNLTSDIFAVDNLLKLRRILGITLTESHHQIIVSAIKKTGCSSWKSLLIDNTANYSDEARRRITTISYHGMCTYRGICILSHLKTPEVMNRLRTYFKIITVRHPLSRLESAFKDKFLDLYRKRFKASIEIDGEMVQMFQDFLDNISNYVTNRHYMPFIKNSNPCVIPFDYIAKLETATLEMEYLSKNYLSGVYETTHRHATKRITHESEHLSNGDKHLPLFSALADPARSIEKLMKHYGTDMTLFGYKYVIRDDNVYAECDRYDLQGMCC